MGAELEVLELTDDPKLKGLYVERPLPPSASTKKMSKTAMPVCAALGPPARTPTPPPPGGGGAVL